MPPLKSPVIIDSPIEREYVNDSGKNRVRWYPGWPSTPSGVVVHYSAGYNVKGCQETLEKRGLSVHCSIERDGTIYQHVADTERAIHAGYGRWAGVSNMNNRMFGFEIINFGPAEAEYIGIDEGLYLYDPRKHPEDATASEVWPNDDGRSWYRDETYNQGKSYSRILTTQTCKIGMPDHRKEYEDRWWARYPRRQMRAVLWQTWQWIKAHEILPENIVGHEHVTPHKKQDPGPAFSWKWFMGELDILYRAELPHLLDPNVRTKERVLALQSHLDRMNMPVGGVDGGWGGLTQRATEEAIADFSDIYSLGLTAADAKPENITRLCYAFLNVLGEDPGRR